MPKCFYCEQDHPPCEALLAAHARLGGDYARAILPRTQLVVRLHALERAIRDVLASLDVEP